MKHQMMKKIKLKKQSVIIAKKMTMAIEDLNPTVRRFARSRMEAYPIEYMSGIEYYKRPRNNNYVVWILSIIGIIAVSIAIKVM